MFSSPAKRRKLSPVSTEVFNIAPDNEAPAREIGQAAARDRRASFQSPTKASLARFNPGLIPRSGSRSPGKQRVDAVSNAETADADETRRKRVALFERLAPVSDMKENEQPRSENAISGEEMVKHGTTTSQPTRSRSLSPVKFDPRPEVDSLPQESKIFESRQQAQDSDNASTTSEAPAQQANQMRRTTAPIVLLDEGEPELPPTPVELGLESQAPPPSGILSSSPSSRSIRRKKRKMNEGIDLSPLKLRDRRPDSQVQMDVDGVPLQSLRPKKPEFSEEVSKKQRLRDELTAQLERLKGEVETLEKEARGDREECNLFEDGEDRERDLISLLTTSNPSCAPPPHPRMPETLSTLLHAFLPFAPAPPPRSPSASPKLPITIPELKLDNVSELPYLTLFTPLLLSSTTTTYTSTSDPNQPLHHHALTLSAPPPFTPAHFSFSFSLTTNLLTQTVNSVALTSRTPSHAHTPLLNWITRRLQSPILAKDMPGIGCGIGNYWDACVERARTWKEIEHALPHYILSNLGSTHDEEDAPAKIAPYLTQPFITLQAPIDDSDSTIKALLVTYDLCISEWTGEVSAEVAICTRGFGGRVEEGVRRAFKGLAGKMGVVGAVRGLCAMVLEG